MPSVMEMEYTERLRKAYAFGRQLPVATSWQDIFAYDEEARRRRKVLRYGLAPDATAQDILNHETALAQEKKDAERRADARELGLPETATEQEIARARSQLPPGLFDQQYPVDSSGQPETDDSDLG